MSNAEPVPTEARRLLKEGQDHYFRDPPDYAAAERDFRGATEMAPSWGEPFHWLAFALEKLGFLDKACEAARSAIRLVPGDSRPLISLGAIQLSLGRYADAVQSLQEGLALKPAYAEADAGLMLAEAFEGLGEIDRAADLWRQIIKMDPSYPSDDLPMEKAKKKLAKHGLSEL